MNSILITYILFKNFLINDESLSFIFFSEYPILKISPSIITSDVSILNLFIFKFSPFTVNNPNSVSRITI